MRRLFSSKQAWLAALLVCLFVLASWWPGSAGEAKPTAPDARSPTTQKPPQYGGELNIGTVFATLNALSWNAADWPWKHNHDTGAVYEQLFVADLEKSLRRGGEYPFFQASFISEDALTGELAERWEWESPLTLVVHLRRGVHFPDKPGLMKSRELTAEDVVFSYERLDQSPRKIAGYFDHIRSVTARNSHTVVFEFSEYSPEWPLRFGYGYYSGIAPRELANVDATDWRLMSGSGPFQLARYVQGHSQRYSRNDSYWGKERIHGSDYQLPFVDGLTYRILKDEATRISALRTGKLDILENIRWLVVDHLKESTPELRWSRRLQTGGTFIALRTDTEPFDDVRVRRALNMAIDHEEVVELFYGGHAEILGFPMHPEYLGYYESLDEMPPEVQELFAYKPEKAKQLLSEAGYPDGFRFKAQLSVSDKNSVELMPLLASYLAKVGVEVEIEPLEYVAFLSAMNTSTHAPGYMLQTGHVSPTVSLRKNFQTDNLWNPAKFSDPEIDHKLDRLMELRDEKDRRALARELTAEILAEAPYIWLPTSYVYGAWWPWVRNYGGELAVGAVRPGPIYARIWIDQELKKSMGF